MPLDFCVICGQPSSGHEKYYPCPPENCKHQPLWDFVIVRAVTVDAKNGVALPQSSAESTSWYVVAVGEKCGSLQQGDQVLVIGDVGKSIVPLPRERNLYVTKAENLILRVRS